MRAKIKDRRSIGKFTIRQVHTHPQPTTDRTIIHPIQPISSKNKQENIYLQTLSSQKVHQHPAKLIQEMHKADTHAFSKDNPQDYRRLLIGDKLSRYSANKGKQSGEKGSLGKFYSPYSKTIDTYGKIKHQFSLLTQSFTQRKSGLNIPIKTYDYRLSEPTSQTPKLMEDNIPQANSGIKQGKKILSPCICDQNPAITLQREKMKQYQMVLKDDGERMVLCERSELTPKETLQKQLERSVPLLLHEYDKNDGETIVSLRMKISQIKKILIEENTLFKPKFVVPKVLGSRVRPQVSQAEIHRASYEIFSKMLGFQPQLVSLKRLGNCIKLLAKTPQLHYSNIGLIWYFNGSFYLGGWDSSQGELKTGTGLEYTLQQSVYYGEYEHNQRQGYGMALEPTGQVYIGQWRKGQRWGWGKVFNRCGTMVVDGDFEGDMLIRNRLLIRQ